jgi:membrane protein YdbS with pleckstrin-like domain
MFKFILEIILTILFVVSLIFNVIAGSWLLVTLDAIVVILGTINSIFTFKVWRWSKRNDT